MRFTAGRFEEIVSKLYSVIQASISKDEETEWANKVQEFRDMYKFKTPVEPKDETLPKKNKSAFAWFMKEKLDKYKAENIKINFREETKIIGAEWKEKIKNTENAEPYIALAAEDKKRYEEAMIQWCIENGKNPNRYTHVKRPPKVFDFTKRRVRIPRRDAGWFFRRLRGIYVRKADPKLTDKQVEKVLSVEWKKIENDIEVSRPYYQVARMMNDENLKLLVRTAITESSALSLYDLRREILSMDDSFLEYKRVLTVNLLRVLVDEWTKDKSLIRTRNTDISLRELLVNYANVATSPKSKMSMKDVMFELLVWHAFPPEDITKDTVVPILRPLIKSRQEAAAEAEEDAGEDT